MSDLARGIALGAALVGLAWLAVYADAHLDPAPGAAIAPPGRIERELVLTVACDKHGPEFWRVEGPRVVRYRATTGGR